MNNYDGTFEMNHLPPHLANLFPFNEGSVSESSTQFDANPNNDNSWKHQYRSQLEHPKPIPDSHITQLNNNPALFNSPMFDPFEYQENQQNKYPNMKRMSSNIDPTIFGKMNPQLTLKPERHYVPGDTRSIGAINPNNLKDTQWGGHNDYVNDPNSTRYISKRIQQYRFGY